jgi:hypothetical protein
MNKKLVISFLFFETRSCYIAQAGHELTILLPQHPECWDYRYVLQHQDTYLILKMLQ